MQNPKSLELCGDERKHIRRSLKKRMVVYVILIGIGEPLLHMQNPKSVAQKEAKKKNPTDPIMIVVRCSNRCELLTLEIYFLESV